MTTDPYGSPPRDPADAPYAAEPSFHPGPVPDRSEAASKKLAAGLTGILLGTFGVHKFILGYTNAGIIMLAVSLALLTGTVATCGLLTPALPVMTVIGLVEGIIYLTKSDEEFYQTYMVGRREWF